MLTKKVLLDLLRIQNFMNWQNISQFIIISFVNSMKMTLSQSHIISSQLQIVDMFTKAMFCDVHDFLVGKLMHLDDVHQFEGECEESTKSSG